MTTWTFIFMMVVLKLPILGLFGLVWHACRAPVEVHAPVPQDDEDTTDDGGIGDRGAAERGRIPRPPRPRGPHGRQPVPSPQRSRTPARGRRLRTPSGT